MGHYCRICGCSKPHEAFSGKGHTRHICKACAKLPQEEINAFEQSDEIFRYLSQSHISSKNMKRLAKLSHSPHTDIAKYAAIVLEVGTVTPYKKGRLKFLARKHRHLLHRLQETGLILAHHH